VSASARFASRAELAATWVGHVDIEIEQLKRRSGAL
jgi:hypothetical protein